jgi:hypothetical protein
MQVADFNQFGSAKPGIAGDSEHCAQCEAMLTDALDGTLSAADQAAFDLHMVGCSACAAMLADARRGAAWMELLKSSQPEPPASLLERILAQTSNPPAPPIILGPTDRLRVHPPQVPNTLLGRPALMPTVAGHPAVYAPTNILPFRARITHGLRSIGHTMLQPRLAMTAAMAFFSIALTLNLTGVHLSNLRASDLKPSSIMRSAYEAKARVVRYSDNLRVVYELESRVRDLQRSSDDSGSATTTPAPQSTPASQTPDGDLQPDSTKPDGKNPNQKQNRPKPNPGSSRREAPAGNLLLVQFAQRRSSGPSPTQVSVVATPSIFKQEGGLV